MRQRLAEAEPGSAAIHGGANVARLSTTAAASSARPASQPADDVEDVAVVGDLREDEDEDATMTAIEPPRRGDACASSSAPAGASAVPSDIGGNLPCDRHPSRKEPRMIRSTTPHDHTWNRDRARRAVLRARRLGVRRRRAHPEPRPSPSSAARTARYAASPPSRGSPVRASRTSRTSSRAPATSSPGSSTAPAGRCRCAASRQASSRCGSSGTPARARS